MDWWSFGYGFLVALVSETVGMAMLLAQGRRRQQEELRRIKDEGIQRIEEVSEATIENCRKLVGFERQQSLGMMEKAYKPVREQNKILIDGLNSIVKEFARLEAGGEYVDSHQLQQRIAQMIHEIVDKANQEREDQCR